MGRCIYLCEHRCINLSERYRKIQNIEISPDLLGIMDLNFGQSRIYKNKPIFYCTIKFPESYVTDEILKSFSEIKDDASNFPHDWDEKWEIELCKYSSYEEFKNKDKHFSIVQFFEFIGHSLLTSLGVNNHHKVKKNPKYIFCDFTKSPVKYDGTFIIISGICIKAEQLNAL